MDKTENPQGDIDLRLFNYVYKCMNCQLVINLRKIKPIIVTELMGAQPVRSEIAQPAGIPQKMVPAMKGSVLCPKCFDALELDLQPPAIVVPKGVMPR